MRHLSTCLLKRDRFPLQSMWSLQMGHRYLPFSMISDLIKLFMCSTEFFSSFIGYLIFFGLLRSSSSCCLRYYYDFIRQLHFTPSSLSLAFMLFRNALRGSYKSLGLSVYLSRLKVLSLFSKLWVWYDRMTLILRKPNYCNYTETYSQRLFNLSSRNPMSSVVLKVYDLPTDLRSLN